MTRVFQQSLAAGQMGESRIARWLNRRGWAVLPVYEKEIHTGKGPRLFAPDGQLIALDMLAFHPGRQKALWIEAKHKTVFSWYRAKERWVTGIDMRHYRDYLRVADLSPWPVWLLFLHAEAYGPRAEPYPCPTGLFGQTLDYLRVHESHRHKNWGHSGMVYWAYESLKQLATLSEVYAVQTADIPF